MKIEKTWIIRVFRIFWVILRKLSCIKKFKFSLKRDLRTSLYHQGLFEVLFSPNFSYSQNKVTENIKNQQKFQHFRLSAVSFEPFSDQILQICTEKIYRIFISVNVERFPKL